MLKKEDKDGQILILRKALEKILNLVGPYENSKEDFFIIPVKDIRKTAETAIADTTF